MTDMVLFAQPPSDRNRRGGRPQNQEGFDKIDVLRNNPGMWGVVQVSSRNAAGRRAERLKKWFPDMQFITRVTSDGTQREIWASTR
jgi:hypothetical protein